MMLRALLVWFVIALAEVAQGILRVRLLNRRVGDRRARQIGVFTGSALILGIAWLTRDWVGARDGRDCALVGLLWTVLMLAFDVGLGRFVFRASWERIFREFDFRHGGLLLLGMLVLMLAPWLVAR